MNRKYRNGATVLILAWFVPAKTFSGGCVRHGFGLAVASVQQLEDGGLGTQGWGFGAFVHRGSQAAATARRLRTDNSGQISGHPSIWEFPKVGDPNIVP